jgi:hypothetical protein
MKITLRNALKPRTVGGNVILMTLTSLVVFVSNIGCAVGIWMVFRTVKPLVTGNIDYMFTIMTFLCVLSILTAILKQVLSILKFIQKMRFHYATEYLRLGHEPFPWYSTPVR